MFTYYFNHVLSDGSVVFNDARLLDRSLIQCENNIKRILVLHSNHLEHGKIRKSYGLALENSASIYKYLVLTHYQKADIQQQFNISDDKIEVIPHFQHQLLTEPSEKVDDYFCFIGRIAKENSSIILFMLSNNIWLKDIIVNFIFMEKMLTIKCHL